MLTLHPEVDLLRHDNFTHLKGKTYAVMKKKADKPAIVIKHQNKTFTNNSLPLKANSFAL